MILPDSQHQIRNKKTVNPLQIAPFLYNFITPFQAVNNLKSTASIKCIVSDDDVYCNSERKPIPLNLFSTRGTLILRPAYPGVDTGNKEVDYRKTGTDHFQIRFDVRDDHNTAISRYYAVVAFQRHVFTKSNLSKISIVVSPAFSIRNWMPFPISILLGGETKLDIAEGRDLPLMESNSCPNLFAIFETKSINGKTFYQSEALKILNSNEDKEDIQ